VLVRVREDQRFVREGEDLHTVVDIPAPLAALGTTVQVPSLDGDVPLEIPAGTQPGEVMRLRGRGMPPLQRGRTGDLHVHVNVVIPRRLSREQRDLMEQLAGSLEDRNLRSDEGMLSKLKRALAG
jgi:molecular chaperone DnaJ